MSPELVVCWFDIVGSDIDQPVKDARKSKQENRGKHLCCCACGYLITHEKERIAISGKHNHTCTNPAGIIYQIGCFRHAPGCSLVGSATTEYTWFPGFGWQIAICANCGEHLGWFFSDGSEFHGLITDRLVSR